MFDPEFFLRAYGKIYRNCGAMTKGTTAETVDGMSLLKIHNIIGSLKLERYKWTPARRTEIPKANGKTRPLGIPTWSDKLVEEVLRILLEPYYEQRFSPHSHGFRPKRSCQSALLEIQRTWKGTIWFIEGDIKGCFDNIDHTVLLEIIRRDIHDGRLLNLIEGLLKAGYIEDWRYHDNLSGTPQGGIISPLLSNIYLNELDRFVEDTLLPAYMKEEGRRHNREYRHLTYLKEAAWKRGDRSEVKRLKTEYRKLTSGDPCDPNYRRLRYVRYADDFLLGFAGPRDEAEVIRQRLGEFLEQRLKLTLSVEKTLITHAHDGRAKFLGYEISVVREGSLITGARKARNTNSCIGLLMPRKVVDRVRSRYSKHGVVVHRTELLVDTDYTTIQRYQAVLAGIYNYYCMAVNVSARMGEIKWILETSLSKTLASKFKVSVTSIFKRYEVIGAEPRMLRVVIERPEKPPLVAVFGGIRHERRPEGMGITDFRFDSAWFAGGDKRSEVVQRLVAGKCELCGKDGPMMVHHIRRLADIDRPGRRPRTTWERIMSARKRKTLVVCEGCHGIIHAGRYDGPSPG
jgi:group II intron reverse transcriptase/maturase